MVRLDPSEFQFSTMNGGETLVERKTNTFQLLPCFCLVVGVTYGAGRSQAMQKKPGSARRWSQSWRDLQILRAKARSRCHEAFWVRVFSACWKFERFENSNMKSKWLITICEGGHQWTVLVSSSWDVRLASEMAGFDLSQVWLCIQVWLWKLHAALERGACFNEVVHQRKAFVNPTMKQFFPQESPASPIGCVRDYVKVLNDGKPRGNLGWQQFFSSCSDLLARLMIETYLSHLSAGMLNWNDFFVRICAVKMAEVLFQHWVDWNRSSNLILLVWVCNVPVEGQLETTEKHPTYCAGIGEENRCFP